MQANDIIYQIRARIDGRQEILRDNLTREEARKATSDYDEGTVWVSGPHLRKMTDHAQ